MKGDTVNKKVKTQAERQKDRDQRIKGDWKLMVATTSKYPVGKVFELYGDGNDGWEAIKGWYELEHCQKEIDIFYGQGVYHALKVIHTYAFWGVGMDECGEPSNLFYLRDEPGRGRFKVSQVMVEKV